MFHSARRVAIIGSQRIPFVRSFREYSKTSNHEMLVAVIEALAEKFSLRGKRLGEVSLGAVMTSSIEWNLAREVVLGTSLDPHTPAFNVQRACATSLEAGNLIALKIAAGQIECAIGGGSDTNSDLPIMVQRKLAWKLIDINNAKSFSQRIGRIFRIRPGDLKPAFPGIVEPRTALSMGQHTERMVKEWKITREAQDEIAFQSHMKAAQAYREGFYADLIVPFKGVSRDMIVREDTSLEKLAQLKPVFDKTAAGTMTAGNSTALTDGAAAVFYASDDYAKKNGLPVLAYFSDAEAAAVDHVHGAGLLMAPTIAVSRMLARNNLSLQDFDFYEIHEAFAGQLLCTLNAWGNAEYCKRVLGRDEPLGSIDKNKLNVKGGSVAVGHPFGATGARIVGTLAKLLHQRGKGRGLISICTGGGMGVAAILER